MGKIWMPGGGGSGAGSDDCTGQRGHLLENYSAITKDSNDEVADGTMPNLSARTNIQHASDNETKVLVGDDAFFGNNTDGVARIGIRWNGSSGYIEQGTLMALEQTKLAAKGGLTAGKMISGQSAFGINGSIPTLGGQTITPGTSQQTVSSSGKYMTGNVVVNGDADLVAGNILRGKNIFNVSGSSNVLKYMSGNATPGSGTLSLPASGSWFYIDVNPGFAPVFALAISGNSSFVWRTGASNGNWLSFVSGNGGYYEGASSSWTWTSSAVRLPCATRQSACYYYIFGY